MIIKLKELKAVEKQFSRKNKSILLYEDVRLKNAINDFDNFKKLSKIANNGVD